MFSIPCRNDFNDYKGFFFTTFFDDDTHPTYTWIYFYKKKLCPKFSLVDVWKKYGNKIKVNEMKEENVNLTQHKSHWHVTHPQTQRSQFFSSLPQHQFLFLCLILVIKLNRNSLSTFFYTLLITSIKLLLNRLLLDIFKESLKMDFTEMFSVVVTSLINIRKALESC